jgi:23S rRNA (uracil1939-C5)-methyltransferase
LIRLDAIPPSARVAPPCPHFGPCGGCQYQDVAYQEQLRGKRGLLANTLRAAGLNNRPEIAVHAAEPYGYRNRIRMRVLRTGAAFDLGYNAASGDPLAISTCLIAAPALWAAAQSLLAAAADRDAAQWLAAAGEVELFANHDLTQVQVTLLCAPRTNLKAESFARALAAFQAHAPQGVAIVGAGAIAADLRSRPTGRTLAAAGAAGLAYRVGDESYWITRGGFFQVNRFLVNELVQLVADGRAGALAWDLYAGVGLFSRVLARSFTQVTAVEANPTASADNRSALAKLSYAHTAVTAATLDFLRRAVLERDRPELIVLDPPRAGAGLEVCALLARVAPQTIVYVSCDPATLARDLAALLLPQFRLTALHLLDLFPQTAHLETVAVLERSPAAV